MKYYLPDRGETAEDAQELHHPLGDDWKVPDDPRDYARDAAAYVHDFRDGWEASWPMRIAVLHDDGEEIVYLVECEMVPSFSASKER